MRRTGSLLVVALALVLAASAPASAADTVVAHVQRPSAVRDYGGIQVFSAFDGGAYRLAVRRQGRVELLRVAPSQAPFDADIGPDREGRPALIYTRCKVERADLEFGRSDSGGCDLVVFSLTGDAGERPVRAANTSANETRPTLWKGRIAFAREVKGRDVVYTRALASPRSRPSLRLPVVPRSARGERTRGGSVRELELSGDRLAQIVSYSAVSAEGGISFLSDLRLVGVSDRVSRLLARVSLGQSGPKYFVGLGFAGAHLGWAYQSLGAGGELTPGIYRLRLSTGRVARAAVPRVADYNVAGFALFAADGAYVIDGDYQTAQDAGAGCRETIAPQVAYLPCQLIRSSPLRFRPARQRGGVLVGP